MNSPILQAELRYQRRNRIPIRRKWLRRLYRAVVIAGLCVSVLLFGFELLWALVLKGFGVNLFFGMSQLTQAIIVQVLPLTVLFPIVLILHFSLLLQTLMLASNAITREKQNGTWQTLRLTDQSARRIVVGKWGATVLHLTPQYLLLSALRIGVIIYVGLDRYRIMSFYYSVNNGQWYYDIEGLPFDLSLMALFIGASLITLFSFVNLMFTAALGILIAALRGGQRAGEQVALGFALRVVILILPALFLIVLGRHILTTDPLTPDKQFVIEANALGFSLLDNGTQVSAASLTAPRYALNYGALGPPFYIQFFPPQVIVYALVFYGLILLISLAAAIALVRKRA